MDSDGIGSESQNLAMGTSEHRDTGWTLPDAMTGRASPAKAAVGDKPVYAYIANLPQPQRGIAAAVDALAARTLPDLQRSVKWGMAYYGVGDGWCFSCGGFAGHVKLMVINGTALKPVPPVTPVGMGKSTRAWSLSPWMTSMNGRPRRGWNKSHPFRVSGARSVEPGAQRPVVRWPEPVKRGLGGTAKRQPWDSPCHRMS
jgi:hypothetical protein